MLHARSAMGVGLPSLVSPVVWKNNHDPELCQDGGREEGVEPDG